MLAFFCVSFHSVPLLAQATAPVPPDAVASMSQGAAPSMTRPSEMVEPALTALQRALSGVRLEKWKMSGELRDAADGDIRSLEQDFRETLPPLLATADSEPGSVAKVLPAVRNVDAVYDVALRVSAMGRLAAPAGQNAALVQALQGLAEARKQMGDQLQAAAVAEESRVGKLQASLRAREATVPVSAPEVAQPVVKPVMKPKKKVVRPKVVVAPGADGGAGPAKQP